MTTEKSNAKNTHPAVKTIAESAPVLAAVGAADVALTKAKAFVAGAAERQATIEQNVEARVSDFVAHAVTTVSEVSAKVSATDPKLIATEARDAVRSRLAEVDVDALRAQVKAAPKVVSAKARELAGEAEVRYNALAVHGKELIDQVRTQQATQDLLAQGKVAVAKAKAAATVARKAVDDTTAAALRAAASVRSESVEVADEVKAEVVAATDEVKVDVAAATESVSEAAHKGAANTASAVKGAATSARKTATAGKRAVTDAAKKTGA